MNQDQVAEKLRSLAEDVPPFTLLFSGKKSKKVNGLYMPSTKEIIIHNKNMESDAELIYTAIHEFAHHVVTYRSGGVVLSNRCHTGKFWAVFHELLRRAEELGVYSNPFRTDEEFIALTERIKNEFLLKNGTLMKEFASVLMEVRKKCLEKHLSFDDYVDRELGIEKTTAGTLLKIEQYDINPAIGYDNMKTVAGIKDEAKREVAEKAFLEGESGDTVKTNIVRQAPEPEDIPSPVNRLQAEKDKLEKAIESLRKKLQVVDRMLEDEKNKLTVQQ